MNWFPLVFRFAIRYKVIELWGIISMIYDPTFEEIHTHTVLLTLQKMKKGLPHTPPPHVHTTQSPARLSPRQECLLLHSFKYFFLETILYGIPVVFRLGMRSRPQRIIVFVPQHVRLNILVHPYERQLGFVCRATAWHCTNLAKQMPCFNGREMGNMSWNKCQGTLSAGTSGLKHVWKLFIAHLISSAHIKQVSLSLSFFRILHYQHVGNRCMSKALQPTGTPNVT